MWKRDEESVDVALLRLPHHILSLILTPSLSLSLSLSSFLQMGSETKRPRLDSQALSASSSSCPSPSSSPAATAQQASRRSQRQRRGRGEKEIIVSSDQTLLDLKREVCPCTHVICYICTVYLYLYINFIQFFPEFFFFQIMKKFQVAPFDQHLTCNGRDLNDNQATLASLRIFPGTVIILQVK